MGWCVRRYGIAHRYDPGAVSQTSETEVCVGHGHLALQIEPFQSRSSFGLASEAGAGDAFTACYFPIPWDVDRALLLVCCGVEPTSTCPTHPPPQPQPQAKTEVVRHASQSLTISPETHARRRTTTLVTNPGVGVRRCDTFLVVDPPPHTRSHFLSPFGVAPPLTPLPHLP